MKARRPALRHRGPGAALAATAIAALIAAPARALVDPIEVLVPMRDGAQLAADLYLPQGSGPWPTILIQTPYDKNRFREQELPLATEDYAWLIVDWRGHYGSGGWPPLPGSLGPDGYDTVEWIAAQSWSDGNVGGWGASALGSAQYATARERPPHFRAGVPLFADPVRDYQQFFPGGAQSLEYMLQQALLGYIDYDFVLSHPLHDAYWELSEAIGEGTFEEVAVPMLVIAGWYDLRPGDVLYGYTQLAERSDPGVRAEHRLLIGPWTHAHEESAEQGELSYPQAVGAASEAALAFLDLHVRGVGPGVADRVRWFEMGSDRFRPAEGWPLEPDLRVLHLLPGGRLAEEAPPAGDPSETVPGDPLDPSPTHGGPRPLAEIFGWLEGPADLSAVVESRPDALVFSTEPLSEPITLLGAPRVVLELDSDRLDTDLVVRLTDVYPDGRSMFVTDGVRRARFRGGFESEELLNPGELATIEVELQPTGLTLLPGHRLRLVVTVSNSPRFHVNPNDGGPLYSPDATPLPVVDRIHLGAAAPSTLDLPVLAAAIFADGFESGGTGAWSRTAP